MGLSVSGHLKAWGIIQARKRAANEKVRLKMQPELTKGLLESVEFANDRLADCAAVAKESHCNADGKWDSEKIHEEFQACLRHCFRLECFARSLATVLRRDERQAVVAAAN